MPADYGNTADLDDLDLEDMKPPQLDYYAVLNLSKAVRVHPPFPLSSLHGNLWMRTDCPPD